MFEIRVRGTGSLSPPLYFKKKENADNFCDELNKYLHVYYVMQIILQDEID